MFGKGQDKKVKVKADQATKQKTFNSTKNNKKQQFTGIQDEADWNVSTIDDIAWKVFFTWGGNILSYSDHTIFSNCFIYNWISTRN